VSRRTPKQRFVVPVVFGVLLVLRLARGTCYRVDETAQVIITHCGQPVGHPMTMPGLQVKSPCIQTVRRFDNRVLAWEGSPD
jgi:hypothetical protein